MSGPLPGLCGRCTHARVIETRTGSRFFLCQRSAADPAFPRYPRLPVLACRGFAPAAAEPLGKRPA
ncbi:MAG TPA: hypothetical protein VFX29_07875 [Longimicrobiaceae bacterium]|nr:hypothetical protein [Longimicrobiaceae bacterium]